MTTSARPRVLICEAIAEGGISALRERVDVDMGIGWSAEELAEKIGEYDGIVVRSATKVTAELIAKGTKLKVVGRAGTGVDNVDVAAATRRGIIVVNAPTSNSLSAAEHAIALLVSQARNVPQAHDALVDGRWERSKFGGIEITGKTLGILGFGRIGQLVAERAHGLRMNVIAFDPFMTDARFAELGVERAATPEDLYGRCDFITLHLASTPETKNFVGAAAFAAMKPGTRLINAARGDVVDTDALVAALKSGHLGGAGIDVFPEEPCTDSPLFGLAGVVVTPHLGASTTEAQDRAGTDVAEQVAAALCGGVVTSAVNIPSVGPEALRLLGPFLPVAQQLGRLLVALGGGTAEPIEIICEGTLAEHDTRLLASAVLVGALTGVVEDPVNLVNATGLAKERGIVWSETSTPTARDYTSLLTVRSGNVSLSGTNIGTTSRPRLVSAFGRELEIELDCHFGIFKNRDVPGIIGQVGTILGRAGVNIASMAVSRGDGEGAVMAMTADSKVPEATVQEICAIEGFDGAWFVELG